MKLDDLLSLLFLLFFIVAPVIKGLLRRGEPASELVLPPDEPPATPVKQRPPQEPSAQRPPKPRPIEIAHDREPQRPRAEQREEERRPRRRRLRLDLDRSAILEGIVWHEILSEPRGRRPWKPKR